jgi:copper homeostasis protein
MDAVIMDLEVCIDSVESAIAAERGGAKRVELCSDLLEGGITPGAGLIASVRRRIGIDLFVMIRPRGGDFCYTELEFDVMRDEIAHARNLGADGVVLGLLNEHGHIDVARTRALVEFAAPLPVTFHRAIDMTPDLVAALDDVIAAGAVRILTSGGAPSVQQGMAEIARMAKAARGRIAIMPGGGVTPSNIAAIVAATGATQFHSSARTAAPSRMSFRKQEMAMGDLRDREYQNYIVREESVRALVQALAAASANTVGAPAD